MAEDQGRYLSTKYMRWIADRIDSGDLDPDASKWSAVGTELEPGRRHVVMTVEFDEDIPAPAKR